MAPFFRFPDQAAFNRILPKNKIYAYANPGAKIRSLFVSQVSQIKWRYKLSPETIRLAARSGVPEIQIFEIELKTPELGEDVLRCIDKAIPFPIFYELICEGKIKGAATYKRPNEADSGKWVVADYYETDWLPADVKREPLPVALDLGGLYEQMLRALIGEPPRRGESLKDQVARIARIRSMQQEYIKMESRLKKEGQFNRKVEINAKMRSLKRDIDSLIASKGRN